MALRATAPGASTTANIAGGTIYGNVSIGDNTTNRITGANNTSYLTSINLSSNSANPDATVEIKNLVLTSITPPASPSGGAVVGFQSEIDVYGTNAGAAGQHFDVVKPNANITSAINVTQIQGVQTTLNGVASGATLSGWNGIVCYYASINGTVTNAYSIRSGGGPVSGSGTISNLYEFYVDALNSSSVTVTNRWAFYNASTSPIATVGPIQAIGTNGGLAFNVNGTGSFNLGTTGSGVNAPGNSAINLQPSTSANTQVASGSGAVVIGGYNTASGQQSTSIGASNSSLATYSVALGYSHTIGNPATAGVALGQQMLVYGPHSVGAGYLGYDFARYGAFVFASGYGVATRPGLPQTGFATLRGRTTVAASVVLTTDGAAASSANVLNLTTNETMCFTGICVANNNATSSKSWTVQFTIRKGANNAATVLVGSTVTALHGDAGLAACTLVITADTTNGGVAATFTGVAATTLDIALSGQWAEAGG